MYVCNLAMYYILCIYGLLSEINSYIYIYIAVSKAYVVGPMARPEARGSGRAWASNMKLFCGPGLDIIVAGRAGPGPHNSICGPGPGQVCTTAAGPCRAWVSNHICLDFRPV